MRRNNEIDPGSEDAASGLTATGGDAPGSARPTFIVALAGPRPGVYDSRDRAEAYNAHGPDARYRTFGCLREALTYYRNHRARGVRPGPTPAFAAPSPPGEVLHALNRARSLVRMTRVASRGRTYRLAHGTAGAAMVRLIEALGVALSPSVCDQLRRDERGGRSRGDQVGGAAGPARKRP
jgi:hypothetical protein